MPSRIRITIAITATSVALLLLSACATEQRNSWTPASAQSDTRRHLLQQCKEARAELPAMRKKYSHKAISFLQLSDFEIRLFTAELRLLRLKPETRDMESEQRLVKIIAQKYNAVLDAIKSPGVPAEERNAWSLRAMDFFAKEPLAHSQTN